MLSSEDVADAMIFVCEQSKHAHIMKMRIGKLSNK